MVSFDAGAVYACSGVVGVLAVDEPVDEYAALLAVNEPAVDEDGARGLVVEAGLPSGEERTADGDVETVGVPTRTSSLTSGRPGTCWPYLPTLLSFFRSLCRSVDAVNV